MNEFDGESIDRKSYSFKNVIGQPTEWTPNMGIRNVSADATVSPLDGLILAYATAGPISIAMDTAIHADGRWHTIKKIDNANDITVTTTEDIDGASTFTLDTQWQSLTVVSNGVGWRKLFPGVDAPPAVSGSAGVTSVALTMPAIFGVTGSPVTSTGTFVVTADDAGSDKIVFWDDSAGDWVYLTVGTGLAITSTTLNATAVVGIQTIYIPSSAMSPSVTGGCAPLASIAVAADKPDIHSLNFDSTTAEYCQFFARMPKSWDEGTITFSYVWSHAATTTNFGVVFQLQAVAISNDDTQNVSFGTAVLQADTGGTTDDAYISPTSSAVTVGGTPASEDLVVFRVGRIPTDGSDTMAIDARLQGITVYYTTNAATDD
jgi:hypothetical protein